MTNDGEKIKTIEGIVDPKNIKRDPEILSTYAVDGVLPETVVFPKTLDQVSELVRVAQKEDLAFVPWGSGSKMSMGYPPSRLDFVICLTDLNKIVDINRNNLTVTVQSGVRFKDIQRILAVQEKGSYYDLENPISETYQPVSNDSQNRGCFIPMAPPHSHSATMGGIISANSSGPTRLLYGLPRDILLGIRYVASSGEIVGIGGKTVKNVSGYDMCKLLIGAYGSLGILCDMTLRILPLPEQVGTCLLFFSTLPEASDCIERVLNTSLLPAAVELLNNRAYSFLAPEGLYDFGSDGYVVAIGLEGFEEDVKRMAHEIGGIGSESGADKNLYLKEDQHSQFWDAYSNKVSELPQIYPNLVSMRLNYPISGFRNVMELVDSLCAENQLEYGITTRAGSGVTLIHFLDKSGDHENINSIISVTKKLLDHCRIMGGNLLVERVRPELKQRFPIWGELRKNHIVMRRIKQEMDPSGIFSPGRFVGGI